MTNFNVTVLRGEKTTVLSSDGEKTLLDVLRGGTDTAPESPCGGRGTCGKCRVSVRGLLRPVNGGEASYFDGDVLACRFVPAGDCAVTLTSAGEMTIASASDVTLPGGGEGLGLAVDLGTTTVAAAIFDLATGRMTRQYAAPNAQRVFGADVISRIDRCREGKADDLYEVTFRQFREITGTDKIKKAVIAGNTVMEHIAAGLDPSPIAIPPYSVKSLFGEDRSIPAWEDVPVHFVRCVSPYVGGDITAGMLACGLDTAERSCLYVDMGTNGEIALGDRNGYLTCATAAGPCFEGAEISCGMAGAEGAIDRVWAENGEIFTHVIGGGKAKGICGSGLIDATAVLLDLGIISESGKLDAVPGFEDRFSRIDNVAAFALTEDVYITQQDVRKIQLAKAAIRGGIETLTAGKTVEEIIVAGGFGSFVNVENAVKIGLLPDIPGVAISQAGNAAAKGAALLLDSANVSRLAAFCEKCGYVDLTSSKEFSDNYIDNIAFE